MNSKILIPVGLSMVCVSNLANADMTLAHSKSLGMSFTAVGNPWCGEMVSMRVEAEDIGSYSSSAYASTIQKLGQVLSRECSEVNKISISGLAGGKPVWMGMAVKADGWLVQAKNPKIDNVSQEAVTKSGEAVSGEATSIAMKETVPVPATSESTMEIAGWKPGNVAFIDAGAGKMVDIPSRETGCAIRTFLDVRQDLNPSFTMKQDAYGCASGYVRSNEDKRRRGSQAQLFYQGQKQSFARLNGIWYDGYNLANRSGWPKQIVKRYRFSGKNNWNRKVESEKLLAWIGEDRSLRSHYFVTYTYNKNNHLWYLDGQSPVIVVTDDILLKEDPEKAGLAASLSQAYAKFTGVNNINRVSFVITDKLHGMPQHQYQQALKQQNPDGSFYMAGSVTKQRGMPWMVQVETNFAAKRVAFEEAERKREQARLEAERLRAEMDRKREEARLKAERQRAQAEQQRQANLRAQHEGNLRKQYKQLSDASRYDKLRFYATLMLARTRLDMLKIRFDSQYFNHNSVFNSAVQFTHPAMYLDWIRDGSANIGRPMFMLIKADDGDIELPYTIRVYENNTHEEIDGWMLIQASPKFDFSYEDGKPLFEIGIDYAFTCDSKMCLNELDAEKMMKIWYDDEHMTFAMAGRE